MSPLFMCESNSPGSLSAEDCHSSNAGSERDGEGQQTGRRGLKRRERNRDAARKSRKKQTERADDLHEELQNLERLNSALQKEIAALKKDLHFYETALKHHEPKCRLRKSPNSSGSFTHPSLSDPNCTQTSAASPGIPPKSPSSIPTSETSSLGSKTFNYIEKTHRPLAVPVTITPPGVSSAGPSPNPFTSCSSPVTVPYSVQLSTHAAARSSFEASTPSSFLTPVSLSSNSVPSPGAQLQSGQHNGTKTSSAYFTVESFLPKQDPSMTASSNLVPPRSLLEVQNSSAMNQCYPVNMSQLPPYQSTGNPSSSHLLCSLYGSPLQSPAPQLFPVLPQSSLQPHPAPAFDLKLRYLHEVTPNPAPLLTQLTVPSPLDIPPSTSSSFGESLASPLQSHPPPGEPSKDLSLSEFLETNDWILTGANSHNIQ